MKKDSFHFYPAQLEFDTKIELIFGYDTSYGINYNTSLVLLIKLYDYMTTLSVLFIQNKSVLEYPKIMGPTDYFLKSTINSYNKKVNQGRVF